MKIKTESGFSCDLRETVRDDAEMLEDLIALDEGKLTRLPAATERLLGKEGKAALYEHLRGKDGVVKTSDVIREFFEIFKGSKETKNS